jgi:hypothetical protein
MNIKVCQVIYFKYFGSRPKEATLVPIEVPNALVNDKTNEFCGREAPRRFQPPLSYRKLDMMSILGHMKAKI